MKALEDLKMKPQIKFFILLTVLSLVPTGYAQAQQLAKIPSNFNTSIWARPTEVPPETNSPRTFGELPVPCSFSHLRHDDPISKPGEFGQSPLNVFFGNTLTNANSDYQSLRSDGDGTCFGGPLNRTAYFMPSMLNAQGKVVLPDFIDVYYRGTAATQPFPRGLKMLFGHDTNNTSYVWDIRSPRYVWSYSGGLGQWWGSLNPSNSGPTRWETIQPNSYPTWIWGTGYHQMAVRAVSAPCWDGKNLDSADHRSHLAYKVNSGSGVMTCPTSYPVEIPEVTVTVSYRNNGLADVLGWYLSSDKFGGKNDAPGTNWYIGMIPAWDDDVMAAWTSFVLNGIRYGAFGKIDATRILEKPPTTKNFPPTSGSNVRPYFLWSLHTSNFPFNLPDADNNIVDVPNN